MRTLLVDLDNHRKEPVHRALWPIPDNTVGAALMRLIDENVAEKYRPGAFVLDFARTKMYPMRRAPNGKGKTQQDADAIAMVMFTAAMIDVNDIVLIGSRIVQAYNRTFDKNLDWLKSDTIETDGTIRRVWAVPYPDNRFVQFKQHRKEMGKLLAMLRNRTMISYDDKMVKRAEGVAL